MVSDFLKDKSVAALAERGRRGAPQSAKSRPRGQIAVGTLTAERPAHRSVRAQFGLTGSGQLCRRFRSPSFDNIPRLSKHSSRSLQLRLLVTYPWSLVSYFRLAETLRSCRASRTSHAPPGMPALLSLPPSGPNKLRHLVIGPVGIRPQVLGDKYLSQGLDSGGLADVFLEHLLFAIQHHLVESVGQGLAT